MSANNPLDLDFALTTPHRTTSAPLTHHRTNNSGGINLWAMFGVCFVASILGSFVTIEIEKAIIRANLNAAMEDMHQQIKNLR
jgi:hypothetical protein